MIKRGLGKGLEALIPGSGTAEKEVLELKISDVEPNTEQPRKYFEEEGIKNLSESIKNHGVVQPIIVTREKGRYKIIAGERRWRAARLAGLKTIPAILKEYVGKEALEVALIENIQRQDLNPIEEAEALKRLSEEYNLRQEEIACSIGKSRSAVANTLRLLALDSRVRQMVAEGRISGGHARALVAISNAEEQYGIAQELEKKNLSVRETEKYIIARTGRKKKSRSKTQRLQYIETDICEKLRNVLGTKVQLNSGRNRGKIVIEYYSDEELDRILDMLCSIKH